jgi:3',5'-nucleoside bisphosphate phosphatase
MPRGDPFSQLCRAAAALAQPVAADLHTHTNASDGMYTPSQVMAFAKLAKLKAVAITDHDTLAGYDQARIIESSVRLIPGVELSVMWNGRETHLLAYGFDPDDRDVRALLERHCDLRRTRFHLLLNALKSKGIALDVGDLLERVPSVGRGHLAGLLARHGHSPRLLFAEVELPCTPFAEIGTAIDIIQLAGGITSLAHPRAEATRAEFEELKSFGMVAIEVHHPSVPLSRRSELSTWANELGLWVTGGSDCHGPETPGIGSHGLRPAEWQALRFP